MDQIARRSVLRAGGAAGGALLLGACSGEPDASNDASRRGSRPGTPSTSPAPLAALADLSEIPTPTVDPTTGTEAFLIKHGGAVSMLSAVCTHMGCVVEWTTAKREFVCPCHRAVYDARGDVVSGPAPQSLHSLAVEVRGGRVYRSE